MSKGGASGSVSASASSRLAVGALVVASKFTEPTKDKSLIYPGVVGYPRATMNSSRADVAKCC